MMKKYEEYKESGLIEISRIPKHWDEMRLKYLGNLFGGLSGKSGDDFRNEESQNLKPYIPFKNIAANHIITENEFDFVEILPNENQNLVQFGDLLFLMSSENFDDIGKTSVYLGNVDELYLNSFCKGFRPKKNIVDSKWLNYLLNTDEFRKSLSKEAKGFTRINLQIGKIENLNVLLPPLPEQTQIASYLDHQTAVIDTLIAKKEALIEKLKLQRQAVINEAVTRGLDKNVKLLDSGVEWLGEIPEGWEVKKLRYLCEITTGDKDTENKEDEGEFPFFVRSQTIERISSYTFDGEAILTAGDGVGVCKVWHYVNGKFDYHQRVYMLHSFTEVLGKYLFYFLRENFIHEVLKLSAKSTVDSLRRPMFLNFPVLIPSIESQLEIINYCEKMEKDNEATMLLLNTQITKLKLYRQSLISEAVTGKVDLREWGK